MKKSINLTSCKELDSFFAGLEPVTIDELLGKWRVKYLLTKEGTGSKIETLAKFIRIYGKKFISQDKGQAWIFRFLGIKFGLPISSVVLRKMEFRGKISTSMIYNYLPMIDNFRKIDSNTVMGVMESKGKTSMYFYMERE